MTIDDALALPGEAVATTPTWSMATLSVRLLEIAAAGALAGILMILLWMQPRPDLMQAFGTPFFWLKAAYTTTLAGAALAALRSLAHPAGSIRPAAIAALVLVGAMLIAVVVEAAAMPSASLAKLLQPQGILACFFNIACLAAPMLVIAAVGLRQLELERPLLKGTIMGLFCGGVAATIYGVHCPHSTYVFVGLWYTGGIVICGALGAGLVKALRPSPQPLPAE